MKMIRLPRQVMSFGIVGVVNTLIDFVILNVLAIGLGLPRIPSNIVSSTIAMGFSFFANKRVVFANSSKNHHREVVLFLVVTLFGLYVLQTLIIYMFAEQFSAPGDFAMWWVDLFGLDGVLSRDFVVTNSAKALATVVSMVWNFYMYKRFVFIDHVTKVTPEESND